MAAITPTQPDGIELVRRARQNEATLLPAILIADRPDVATATESLRAGAGDYLARELVPAELAASVNRLLAPPRRRRA